MLFLTFAGHKQEPLTTLQAAQNITNRQGSQSRTAWQPPTSPTDEGVDTVWIYGSETFRRIVPGCRILFYSSHGGWQAQSFSHASSSKAAQQNSVNVEGACEVLITFCSDTPFTCKNGM